jgi:signal transduction histidine kinase
MKVKNKLSLQFTFMFAVLLLVVLTGIYVFVEQNRVQSFFNKLDTRAVTAAQFYLAEDNLSKENFKKVLDKFPQSLPQESIRIYNNKYQPRFIAEGKLKWDTAVLRQVASNKVLHLTRGDTQVAGLYYKDNSGVFFIIVSAIDEQGMNMMHEVGLIIIFFSLFSLACTFFLGRIFATMALNPIVKITNNLKLTRASSLHLRLPFNEKKPDKIDILSLTINELLEHLEQSFESQKKFISNASHELRTPITAILGEAEITLMHERKPAAYQQTLKEIIGNVEQLNYILNGLMDMVQASMGNNDFQEIRMDELLWEIIDELTGRNPEININVNYDLPTDESKITLQGSRRLLFIAISNVLKNAVKFSDGKEVMCNLSYNNKGIILNITDTGIGIGQKDLEKVFQPFYRSENAIVYPGAGIGLALTKNIIQLHNGTITIQSEINKITKFSLFFPTYSGH